MSLLYNAISSQIFIWFNISFRKLHRRLFLFKGSLTYRVCQGKRTFLNWCYRAGRPFSVTHSVLRKLMGFRSVYYVVCSKFCNTHVYNTKFAKTDSSNCTKWDLQKVFTIFPSRYSVNDHVTHQPNNDLNLSLSLSLATEQGTRLWQFWFSQRKENCNTFFMGRIFENYRNSKMVMWSAWAQRSFMKKRVWLDWNVQENLQ
jgi:hypothetical protein